MHFLVKVIVSALIISVITEVAKHYSTIGGFIAALPLVSLLSLFWISFEGGSKQELSQFALGVLYGFPASALLLFIVYIGLKTPFHLVHLYSSAYVPGVSSLLAKKYFKLRGNYY